MRMPVFSGLWWWRKIYSNIIFISCSSLTFDYTVIVVFVGMNFM